MTDAFSAGFGAAYPDFPLDSAVCCYRLRRLRLYGSSLGSRDPLVKTKGVCTAGHALGNLRNLANTINCCNYCNCCKKQLYVKNCIQAGQ